MTSKDSSPLSSTRVSRSGTQRDGVAATTFNISEKPNVNVVSSPIESKYEVNDLIKVDQPKPYGVVRWIGILPGSSALPASCEMVGISTVATILYKSG